jgi:hypothetical protein
MVLQALKDRIYDDASNYATRWLAELPHVIWCLRTQVSSATGFSPFHYVKTSNRSRNICNGPLTPVTSTHICNGCCLAPVTYRRARTTLGLASTTPVTNVDF